MLLSSLGGLFGPTPSPSSTSLRVLCLLGRQTPAKNEQKNKEKKQRSARFGHWCNLDFGMCFCTSIIQGLDRFSFSWWFSWVSCSTNCDRLRERRYLPPFQPLSLNHWLRALRLFFFSEWSFAPIIPISFCRLDTVWWENHESCRPQYWSIFYQESLLCSPLSAGRSSPIKLVWLGLKYPSTNVPKLNIVLFQVPILSTFVLPRCCTRLDHTPAQIHCHAYTRALDGIMRYYYFFKYQELDAPQTKLFQICKKKEKKRKEKKRKSSRKHASWVFAGGHAYIHPMKRMSRNYTQATDPWHQYFMQAYADTIFFCYFVIFCYFFFFIFLPACMQITMDFEFDSFCAFSFSRPSLYITLHMHSRSWSEGKILLGIQDIA